MSNSTFEEAWLASTYVDIEDDIEIPEGRAVFMASPCTGHNTITIKGILVVV